MMFKKALLTVVCSMLTLAWAAPASALAVSFDPNGTGSTAVKVDVLDPTVGNSIALGVNAGPGGAVPGQLVTALFQANLGVATLGGVNQFPTGFGPGNFFSVVAGFRENVVSVSPGPFPTLVLDLNPTQPSFFNMYKVPATADNLSGTGFIAGAPILSGVFIKTGAPGDGLSSFTVTSGPVGAPNLDGFGIDNYPLIDTLTGIGAFRTSVLITARNPLFFPDLVVGSTLALVTSELNLNYTTADPSLCFSNNGTTSCNQAGATVASVGTINNFNGPNTMFQTDASASFIAAEVPEPATLTLLGLGLVATARRRLKSRKK